MQQETRFTIQEIINELRMTSTTARYPIKAKSLTLLELCETIDDFNHSSSRSSTQIITRRFHLHPLIINTNTNTNTKQNSTKIIPNNLLDIQQVNQSNLENRNSPCKPKVSRDLAICSSSFPLTTRTKTKINTSINTDNDNSIVYETSTTTISTDQINLPSIKRGKLSLSKRKLSTRSLYISNKPKINLNKQKTILNQPKTNLNLNNEPKNVDAWRHLAHVLQRPIPKDPPTSPLDTLSDSYLQDIQESEQEQKQPNYNSIQEIKIYKRNPLSNSINEKD